VSPVRGNETRIAITLGFVSILVNFILFIFKFLIGVSINSVALKADAWHTLSDSLSSIVLVLGLYLSNKPPDEEHPFGHGRVEKIAGIIIGIMLIFVAFNFLRDSITRWIRKFHVEFNFWSIFIQALCVLIKQILSAFSFHYGKKLKLTSLVADGWHHESDAISSVIFLIGVALNKQIPLVDSYLGVIISILILLTALSIIKENSSPLIGEQVSPECVRKIEEEASRVDNRIIGLHHFHVHRYGNHVEVTFHLRLPGDISLEEAHEIANKLEEKLLKENIHATIHIEPYEENKNLKT